MKLNELLTSINDAPDQGYVLAYTHVKVIFQKYSSIENLKELLKDDDLLEIHLFDDHKEFRAVACKNKTFKHHLAKFEHDEDVYEEEVLLENPNGTTITVGGTMKVLNKLAYTDTGMSYVEDYRLVKEDK